MDGGEKWVSGRRRALMRLLSSPPLRKKKTFTVRHYSFFSGKRNRSLYVDSSSCKYKVYNFVSTGSKEAKAWLKASSSRRQKKGPPSGLGDKLERGKRRKRKNLIEEMAIPDAGEQERRRRKRKRKRKRGGRRRIDGLLLRSRMAGEDVEDLLNAVGLTPPLLSYAKVLACFLSLMIGHPTLQHSLPPSADLISVSACTML